MVGGAGRAVTINTDTGGDRGAQRVAGGQARQKFFDLARDEHSLLASEGTSAPLLDSARRVCVPVAAMVVLCLGPHPYGHHPQNPLRVADGRRGAGLQVPLGV